jgi:hypothetical protein
LNANKGYKISISHTAATAIKTDAPASFLWDVLRGWNKLHPVRPPPPGSVAAAILEKEPAFEADFTEREDAKVTYLALLFSLVACARHSRPLIINVCTQTEKSKKPRFVHNPPNWGPGTRRQINVKRCPSSLPSPSFVSSFSFSDTLFIAL